MKAYREFFLLLAAVNVVSLPAFAQTASPAAAQAPAQKITVHLDPAKTEIHWTLNGTLHNTHGTFALKGGLITVDPATGEAQGEIIVDAESGTSGNHTRDAKMQKEVLESAKYPEVIFHPEKVTGSLRPGDAQQISIGGLFTIHGNDHPLTLPMKVEIRGKDATATTHLVIPYVQWGMKDPGSFFTRVSKQVDVNIVARGSVDGAPSRQ